MREDPTPSPPQPERFRAFRTKLGAFASTGSPDQLRSNEAFCGDRYGWFSSGAHVSVPGAARAGAAMLGAFTAPGALPQALQRSGVDLVALRGASLETVIQAIARAFTPNDPDGAKTETALREALEIALEEQDIVDLDVENFQGFDEETLRQNNHLLCSILYCAAHFVRRQKINGSRPYRSGANGA